MLATVNSESFVLLFTIFVLILLNHGQVARNSDAG